MKEKHKTYYWKSICIILLIIIIGITCNFIVMTSNNGKMPVKMNWNYTDDKHFTYNDSTEFCVRNDFLADNHYWNGTIYSLGDLFIYLGIFLFLYLLFYNFIYWVIKEWRKFKKKRKAYKVNSTGKLTRGVQRI